MMGCDVFVLPQGIPCYVFARKGYHKKSAALVVRYGAEHFAYQMGARTIMHPPGIAHFLEHKLFDAPSSLSGNRFADFAALGATVNAYTQHAHTTYYTEGADNFPQVLQMLLRMVIAPHITPQGVEKEQGIIAEEIAMYGASPHWRAVNGLFRALFTRHPVRESILGSPQDIAGITAQALLECHGHQYVAQNMALVCAGDLSVGQVADALAQVAVPVAETLPTPLPVEEPPHAHAFCQEAAPNGGPPVFQLGVKRMGPTTPQQYATALLLVDMLVGESAPLYQQLYTAGYINRDFTAAYVPGHGYGVFMFGGSLLGDAARIQHAFWEAVARAQREGLCPQRFGILRRKHAGLWLRQHNVLAQHLFSQANFFATFGPRHQGFFSTDMPRVFAHLRREDAEAALCRWFTKI